MHTPHLSRVQASLVALILGGACNDTWLLLSAGAISGAVAVAWLLAQCSNFPGMSRCSFCPTLVATFELSIRKNRRLLISKIYLRLTQMGPFYCYFSILHHWNTWKYNFTQLFCNFYISLSTQISWPSDKLDQPTSTIGDTLSFMHLVLRPCLDKFQNMRHVQCPCSGHQFYQIAKPSLQGADHSFLRKPFRYLDIFSVNKQF